MTVGEEKKKLRVLVLSPRPANPPNTGAKLREYHLLRQMSRWADLKVLSFRTTEAYRDLSFASVEHFERPQGYTPLKVLKGLLGGQALSILNYRSEAMAKRLRELLQTNTYDVILLEALHMAAYEKELDAYAGAALRLWDWHNIESELMERYSQRAPSFLHGLYARETARRLKQLELRLLASNNVHLVCSEREAERLHGWVGDSRVAVVPNGVDCQVFGAAQGQPRKGGLLFVGSLDYHPNIEGLRFLTREVWPELRRRRKTLHLRIVGSRPTPEVREMGDLAGVEVVGSVPKVEPYYAEASAAIVPLFSGGGTRLKVLEAFAAGVPVVSTALGVEGIEAQAGEHYLAAETAGEWVEAVLQAVEGRPELGENARRLAEQRYDWEVVGRDLGEAVRNWRN
ncbi:glycosyltransferase family 4 protein [Bryobacter aggregatus]|uniref:glycosyltransferase family 4 protein n=1 Tax=Bryobacter aggregatus TaxID=360054 RepID=UPI000568B2A2|nr:glycosyltransferase family 4 protein [Bryobacter aggregatus]